MQVHHDAVEHFADFSRGLASDAFAARAAQRCFRIGCIRPNRGRGPALIGDSIYQERLRRIADAASAVTGGNLDQEPISDPSTDEVGTLARGFDAMLSQARSLIAQLGQANEQLTREMQIRGKLEVELRQGRQLESLGRLAAGIAHEINTPIQFVGNNITFLETSFSDLLRLCGVYRQLCQKAVGAPLDENDQAVLADAESAADLDYVSENVPRSIAATQDGIGRVAKIVQSMKSFAHPDRGKKSSADINAALQTTLTVASSEFKYIADVETDLAELPQVPCYLSDLNQVFLNLLVNAAHAISDVVGNSGDKGLIRVKTALDGDRVVVSVSDSGTGIPEAVRERIFDPFFTTKEVGKGTGQGLALARAVIVDKHKGTLTFDTQLGKGTTFHIGLPLLQEAPPVQSSDAA
jgi:two-component system, NtrC family, sensor kinase